jgi:transaldolase
VRQTPITQLPRFGQSPWLDYISRGLIRSGELEDFVATRGLRGVTSNPAIFSKAITGSSDYDADIAAAAMRRDAATAIYEALVLEDIRAAADILAPVYEATDAGDGYVSLEVSPHLVNDTEGTVEEARRLWSELARPNVMIKVPATEAGLPAIERLISRGINVNVTLLFSLERYREVTNAYLAGLERAAADGRALKTIASVASFFLSRIDVMLDPRLGRIVAEGSSISPQAARLRGQIAIACARRAYVILEQVLASKRFRALEAKGARIQRLLWASTGIKNPDFEDVKYIEPLIGRYTVSTMPRNTYEAYEDHGVPALRVTSDADAAAAVLKSLHGVGIDLAEATARLLDEGIDKFIRPFDALLDAIETKRIAALSERAEGGAA